MKIRKTLIGDLDTVMSIYDSGRQYMRSHGNMHQWDNGFPPRELIIDDINKGYSFVVVDENDKILCVYAFLPGPDITYSKIYDGTWPNDKPYNVIHRIAVSEHRKGVASFVYDECLKMSPVIRIDTHKDNIPMQNSLTKNGFTYCGIIHLLSGDERLAYQKERE
ncbi:MAG: GNAT family N-acetyltransferase [Clostridia bacterium]|nr:GNAT family N-acetyltransferase [Clostridia bacterium]